MKVYLPPVLLNPLDGQHASEVGEVRVDEEVLLWQVEVVGLVTQGRQVAHVSQPRDERGPRRLTAHQYRGACHVDPQPRRRLHLKLHVAASRHRGCTAIIKQINYHNHLGQRSTNILLKSLFKN